MFRLIVVLGIVCMAAGGVLASVYKLTLKPIQIAEKKEKEKAIKAVVPSMEGEPQEKKSEDGSIYYIGLKNNNKVGTAIPVYSEDGYSGRIDLILGLDELGKISGLYVLKHLETPGLGSKIGETKFKKQFLGKNLTNYKFSVKKDGGDVDAISGATISSRAVSNAIKQGFSKFKKIEETVQ